MNASSSNAWIAGRSRSGSIPSISIPSGEGPGSERFDQVDLHVPEVMDGFQAARAEHRRRGVVPRVDRVAEPKRGRSGRQRRGSLLDPVEQRAADAPSPVLGMHDPPGPRDIRLLELDLCVRDDHAVAVDRHPGVGGEITEPGPFASDEVLAQDDPSDVVELVGDDHGGHRVEVVRRRRAEPVPVRGSMPEA